MQTNRSYRTVSFMILYRHKEYKLPIIYHNKSLLALKFAIKMFVYTYKNFD